MRSFLRSLCVFTTFVLTTPAELRACQSPPVVDAEAHVSFDLSCMREGQPITMAVTLSNLGSRVPPHADDEQFRISVEVHALRSLIEESPNPIPSLDDDGDSVENSEDTCPERSNEDQRDSDGDGVGDVCDNCPLSWNATQLDSDGDGLGDSCALLPDVDGDGANNDVDNCPTLASPDQGDSDGDAVGDACDNCPSVFNPLQQESDRDGIGSACDNCPLNSNGDQLDENGNGRGDACDIYGCGSRGLAPGPVVVPENVTLVLDDVSSPHADGPTTDTREFTIYPARPRTASPAIAVTVTITDSNGSLVSRERLCVAACEEVDIQPSAHLRSSELIGEAGGLLEYEVVVQRSGVSAATPLRVVIVRENVSDALDLFPIEPAELIEEGILLDSQEEQSIGFTCGLHGPCFTGMSNQFHVELQDASTGELVYDSRDALPSGFGAATVSTSPIAAMEVLAVNDAGGNGALEICESGTVELRAIARNPFIGVEMENVTVSIHKPRWFTLVDYTMHFHDNPMDAYDPTPAELEAVGDVTETDESLVIDIPIIEARFMGPPFSPPTTFRDMFEIDLVFEAPPGGTGPVDEASMFSVEVVGSADGVHKAMAVKPSFKMGNMVSGEVSPLGRATPLRMGTGGRLSWDHGTESRADEFLLHRGSTERMWFERGPAPCLLSRLAEPETVDVDPLEHPWGWFYLVSGRNCTGEGDLGVDSLSDPRLGTGDCP